MSDKPTILCIDDEERVLRSLQLLFQDTHTVYATTSPAEFTEILTQKAINVVICDQRMPDCLGTELLELTVHISPQTMRILLTGYADLGDVIDAINKGEIFRYVTKPWDLRDLRDTVEQATNLSFLSGISEPESVDTAIALGDSSDAQGTAKEVFSPASTQVPKLLVVTDDAEHRQRLHQALGEKYTLIDVPSLAEAKLKIEMGEISVMIGEMTIDGQLTTECVSWLKSHFPAVVSVILTDLKDSSALIEMINTGQVYRCLPKSVSAPILQTNVERAVMRHAQLQANPLAQQRYQVVTSQEPAERRSLLDGVFSNDN